MNIRYWLMSVWAVLLFGCNAQEPAPIFEIGEQSKSAEQRYAKPGAAIQLVDSAVPQLTPGQVAEVALLLRASYQSGLMTVQVTSTDGLEIVGGATAVQYPLSAARQYHLPLQLYADMAGRYYVNLIATISLPDGVVASRALSVVIQVGETESSAAGRAREDAKTSGNEGGVIVLPAEETIYLDRP